MMQLEHIGVAFGRRRVLHDVCATIDEGKVTALMGPNGCGKTTLLRCMAGLLHPTEGRVLLDGKEVPAYEARQLAQRVATVRQQPSADLDFPAFDIVLMGRNPYIRRLHGESAEDLRIVEQCLRQTGTWHLRDSYPAQLSGGELQRVMIARALAQQTPLLLMDEPVSNLDIAHQIETMRLLRGLGKTVLIVLHDLNLALHYCDQLLLLHDGTLLFDGPIADGLVPHRIRTAYGVDATVADGHVRFSY